MDKLHTGIVGLDLVSSGGLPRNRSTLICGGPGCGKSMLALAILANAAEHLGEPVVFVSFEESVEDILINAESIGLDLQSLMDKGMMRIEYLGATEDSVEIGGYDLDGLIIRLGYAIDLIGASVVAIDTAETLFSMFDREDVIRRGLVHLFKWLKGKGVTSIITAERGDGQLTRFGLEEYVSDCVILLDHDVSGDVSTRLLRIVKYRGANHGTNEYPFLIDDDGFTLMPVTGAELNHEPSSRFMPTGLPGLDRALDHKGFRRHSTVLITGSPGAGKTNLCLTIAARACERGEKAAFFSFEESPAELISNAHEINLDLQPLIDSGQLLIYSARPSMHGLETHLVTMYRMLRDMKPDVAVIDPVSSLSTAGSARYVHQTIVRLIDMLKERRITGILTALRVEKGARATSGSDISSIIDTWLNVRQPKGRKHSRKSLEVVKSRGMSHSGQPIPLVISARGIELEGGAND